MHGVNIIQGERTGDCLQQAPAAAAPSPAPAASWPGRQAMTLAWSAITCARTKRCIRAVPHHRALPPCSKFAQMADQKAGQVTAKVKRLGKELRNLQSGRTPLPVHAAASIFVRYDEDRNDKMRCIITGGGGGCSDWCGFGHVQQQRTVDTGCSPQARTRMFLVLLHRLQ